MKRNTAHGLTLIEALSFPHLADIISTATSNPLEYVGHLQTVPTNAISVCGATLQSKVASFFCSTCTIDESAIFCRNCFLNGNHNNHQWRLTFDGYGVCDCGDRAAIAPSGFCTSCGHSEELINNPFSAYSEDDICFLITTFAVALCGVIESNTEGSKQFIQQLVGRYPILRRVLSFTLVCDFRVEVAALAAQLRSIKFFEASLTDYIAPSDTAPLATETNNLRDCLRLGYTAVEFFVLNATYLGDSNVELRSFLADACSADLIFKLGLFHKLPRILPSILQRPSNSSIFLPDDSSSRATHASRVVSLDSRHLSVRPGSVHAGYDALGPFLSQAIDEPICITLGCNLTTNDAIVKLALQSISGYACNAIESKGREHNAENITADFVEYAAHSMQFSDVAHLRSIIKNITPTIILFQSFNFFLKPVMLSHILHTLQGQRTLASLMHLGYFFENSFVIKRIKSGAHIEHPNDISMTFQCGSTLNEGIYHFLFLSFYRYGHIRNSFCEFFLSTTQMPNRADPQLFYTSDQSVSDLLPTTVALLQQSFADLVTLVEPARMRCDDQQHQLEAHTLQVSLTLEDLFTNPHYFIGDHQPLSQQPPPDAHSSYSFSMFPCLLFPIHLLSITENTSVTSTDIFKLLVKDNILLPLAPRRDALCTLVLAARSCVKQCVFLQLASCNIFVRCGEFPLHMAYYRQASWGTLDHISYLVMIGYLRLLLRLEIECANTSDTTTPRGLLAFMLHSFGIILCPEAGADLIPALPSTKLCETVSDFQKLVEDSLMVEKDFQNCLSLFSSCFLALMQIAFLPCGLRHDQSSEFLQCYIATAIAASSNVTEASSVVAGFRHLGYADSDISNTFDNLTEKSIDSEIQDARLSISEEGWLYVEPLLSLSYIGTLLTDMEGAIKPSSAEMKVPDIARGLLSQRFVHPDILRHLVASPSFLYLVLTISDLFRIDLIPMSTFIILLRFVYACACDLARSTTAHIFVDAQVVCVRFIGSMADSFVALTKQFSTSAICRGLIRETINELLVAHAAMLSDGWHTCPMHSDLIDRARTTLLESISDGHTSFRKRLKVKKPSDIASSMANKSKVLLAKFSNALPEASPFSDPVSAPHQGNIAALNSLEHSAVATGAIESSEPHNKQPSEHCSSMNERFLSLRSCSFCHTEVQMFDVADTSLRSVLFVPAFINRTNILPLMFEKRSSRDADARTISQISDLPRLHSTALLKEYTTKDVVCTVRNMKAASTIMARERKESLEAFEAALFCEVFDRISDVYNAYIDGSIADAHPASLLLTQAQDAFPLSCISTVFLPHSLSSRSDSDLFSVSSYHLYNPDTDVGISIRSCPHAVHKRCLPSAAGRQGLLTGIWRPCSICKHNNNSYIPLLNVFVNESPSCRQLFACLNLSSIALTSSPLNIVNNYAHSMGDALAIMEAAVLPLYKALLFEYNYGIAIKPDENLGGPELLLVQALSHHSINTMACFFCDIALTNVLLGALVCKAVHAASAQFSEGSDDRTSLGFSYSLDKQQTRHKVVNRMMQACETSAQLLSIALYVRRYWVLFLLDTGHTCDISSYEDLCANTIDKLMTDIAATAEDSPGSQKNLCLAVRILSFTTKANYSSVFARVSRFLCVQHNETLRIATDSLVQLLVSISLELVYSFFSYDQLRQACMQRLYTYVDGLGSSGVSSVSSGSVISRKVFSSSLFTMLNSNPQGPICCRCKEADPDIYLLKSHLGPSVCLFCGSYTCAKCQEILYDEYTNLIYVKLLRIFKSQHAEAINAELRQNVIKHAIEYCNHHQSYTKCDCLMSLRYFYNTNSIMYGHRSFSVSAPYRTHLGELDHGYRKGCDMFLDPNMLMTLIIHSVDVSFRYTNGLAKSSQLSLNRAAINETIDPETFQLQLQAAGIIIDMQDSDDIFDNLALQDPDFEPLDDNMDNDTSQSA